LHPPPPENGKIQLKLLVIRNHIRFAIVRNDVNFSPRDADRIPLRVEAGMMFVYPAWHFSCRVDGFDLPRFRCQSVDRSESLLPLFRVAQASDDIDAISTKRCRMEIRRRKDISRIAVDLEVTLAVVNHDVVINEEIGIVTIHKTHCTSKHLFG
jgi:hypothetical protein